MAHKLDGRKLAKEIEVRLQQEIMIGLQKGVRPPGLAVVRVGDDPASSIYVSNKEKACARIGIKSVVEHFQKDTPIEEIRRKIRELNQNKNIDGILLQLPLPTGFDENVLIDEINPDKDADGLHTVNLGRLLKGEPGARSCTPAGVMALLSKSQIRVEGKRAVVIGRSILVGKPMALMLQAANATVSMAHSKTRNLSELAKQAELLIVAAGKPQIIGSEHVQSNAVVVDVGIHRIKNELPASQNSDYRICGDVNADEVDSIVSAITPVPGGVGPMTVSMLLVNTVSNWQYHCGLSFTLKDLLP